jgi:hypothetical protein
VGQIQWGDTALQALLGHEDVGLFLREELLFSLGFDGARGDAIDADVVFSQLSCQTAGEADDGSLGGNVVAQVLQAGEEGDGGDVDDRSGALPNHVGRDELRAVEDTLQVGVVHGVPLLFCHFQKGLAGIDAGVVDQDIDAAKASDRVVDHFCHGIATAGVGLKGKGGAAFRLERGRLCLDCFAVQVGEEYMSTVFGKELRDSGADAGSRTGYDGDLILQQFHRVMVSKAAVSRSYLQPEARQVALLQVVIDEEARSNSQRDQANGGPAQHFAHVQDDRQHHEEECQAHP